MKKFASLVLTAVLLATMLTVFAVPTSAESIKAGGKSIEVTEHMEQNDITLYNGATLTLKAPVFNGVYSNEYLSMQDSTLIVEDDGFLNSKYMSFFMYGDNNKIIVQEGGSIDVTLTGSHDADDFCDVLAKSNTPYKRINNRVLAGESLENYLKDYGENCALCGKSLKTEESDENPTGSALSEGSLTIIVGVACLAVGFLVATFIFKKKKPAIADGSEKDE